MKGGKCCKCYGVRFPRGKYGTTCYDHPMNCCGLKPSTKKKYIREQKAFSIRRKERRKRNFTNKIRRFIRDFTRKIKRKQPFRKRLNQNTTFF